MLRLSRPVRVAVLTLGAMALAACGGESSETNPGDEPDPSPSVSEPESAADVSPAKRANRGPGRPFNVRLSDLGMHSFTTKPGATSGSIRMNCSPTWRDTNPRKGVYDWERFDFLLERAESWGYEDIVYVFCGTPDWAAGKSSRSDEPVLGGKSTHPPAEMSDWADYVRAVAQRYRGRITGYEVWNEASSPQFYSGSVEEMAQMTKLARKTIRSIDPNAVLLAAGTQTHRSDYYDGFFPDYLAELAKRDWPVDAFSVHAYPPNGSGPSRRVKQLQMVRDDLAEAGAPRSLQLWDTEVNYEQGSGGGKAGRIKGDKAAAWTAITYLDGWGMGVRRSYWYLWTDKYYGFPGIQMRQGDPSTAALSTLAAWVVGTRFLGCESQNDLESCRFSKKTDGQAEPFSIAWTRKGETKIPVEGRTEVCPVTGDQCETEKSRVLVTTVPVRLT